MSYEVAKELKDRADQLKAAAEKAYKEGFERLQKSKEAAMSKHYTYTQIVKEICDCSGDVYDSEETKCDDHEIERYPVKRCCACDKVVER